MASPQPIPIPKICHFPLRSAMDRSTSYVSSHIWIHCGYWHLYQVLGVNWLILAFILEMNVVWLCMLSHFSCIQLCNPMDCNQPGSSVYRILQSRILEWTEMPSFRGASLPRDWTSISYVPCIDSRFFKGLQTQGLRQTISFPTPYEFFVPPLWTYRAPCAQGDPLHWAKSPAG